ncbi:aldo-keto reductase family 1 member B1-like isoform X1 [Portunus trituberculatus]|uniref:aldo-keto reductase family 1 member B1-like isoform X1 n=1 Tax=Portunus trituberculatus TaxID=210409 RepID=UPI001E1D079E|nr:aldo-keto reductase family 1 member B1-like isoform X1 [Portunus trituberculatus]
MIAALTRTFSATSTQRLLCQTPYLIPFCLRHLATMSASSPMVTFNNGQQYPILGLGTWKGRGGAPRNVSDVPGSERLSESCLIQSKPGEVCQAVKNAISCGYRHIDGALIYGNENEVGAAIKAKIEDGTVTRDDLFITSKCWNIYHSQHLVVPSLKESLTSLGLDYLDLYLIHWPMGYQEGGAKFPVDSNGKTQYSDVDYLDTWKGMEEAQKSGLTKSIGVSNFNKKQIERVLAEGTIKPVTNQIECHPYLNQRKMIDFCRSKGIYITAYSPLGSPDRPWAKPDDPLLMEDPKIVAIAEKYKKTPAQILIRYQIQRDVIVIPKSVTKSRIESNFQVFDFELSSEDMKIIDSFDCNGRVLHLTWVSDHKHYPFHDEF